MPIGGKLLLKGGVPLAQKKIKKKKKSEVKDDVVAAPDESGHDPPEPASANASKKDGAVPINVMSGKSYEAEFDLEMARLKEGKAKSTPWGSSYRAAPEILHGYSSKVKGVNASERLDMRSASRSDKFCK